MKGPCQATQACTSICGSPQAKPRGRSPGDTGGFLELKPTAPKAPTDDKKMRAGLGSGFLCTPWPRPLLSSPDQAHVHTLTPHIHSPPPMAPPTITLAVNRLLCPPWATRPFSFLHSWTLAPVSFCPVRSHWQPPSPTPTAITALSPTSPGEAGTATKWHPEQKAWAPRA